MTHKYKVNGMEYSARTTHICQVCKAQADGTYLWLKQKLPNGDTALECPFCMTIVMVPSGSVSIDPVFKERQN